MARWLEDSGVDLIEISGGNYEQPSMFDMAGRPEDADWPQRESTRRREAFFLEYAARLRAEVNLPLAVTGGFRSRRVMREALHSKALDVIGLARPLVTEPDLPRRVMNGTSEGAIRHEDRLRIGKGRFGPNSPIFLFKALNALGAAGLVLPSDHPSGREPHAAVPVGSIIGITAAPGHRDPTGARTAQVLACRREVNRQMLDLSDKATSYKLCRKHHLAGQTMTNLVYAFLRKKFLPALSIYFTPQWFGRLCQRPSNFPSWSRPQSVSAFSYFPIERRF